MTRAPNWLDALLRGVYSIIDGDDVALTERGAIKFVGDGVTTEDDATNKRTVVTVTRDTLGPDDAGNAHVLASHTLNTSNAHCTIHHYVVYLATTDATPTVAFTFAIGTNRGIRIDADVSAISSDAALYSNFPLRGNYRRDSGTAAIVGAADDGTAQEDDAGTAAAIGRSTNNLQVTVTGLAATNMKWTLSIYIHEAFA